MFACVVPNNPYHNGKLHEHELDYMSWILRFNSSRIHRSELNLLVYPYVACDLKQGKVYSIGFVGRDIQYLPVKRHRCR